MPRTLAVAIVLFSSMSFYSYAEISSELKNKIAEDFREDSEFQRGFLEYLSAYDKLYEGELYKSKDKFKEQYLKYIKSKNCAFYLVDPNKLAEISDYMIKLEALKKAQPNYSMVHQEIVENYGLKDKFTPSPQFDGYKFCSFEVSKDRVAKKLSTLNDVFILEANISYEEKVNLIFKDSPSLIKTLIELKENQTRLFTDKNLIESERVKTAQLVINNLSCAVALLGEEKLESFGKLYLSLYADIQKNPNYFKDEIERKILIEAGRNSNEEGDIKNCSFAIPENELAIIKETKKKDNEIFEAEWKVYEEYYSYAHPDIKTMINLIEQKIIKMGKNISEKAKRKFLLESVPKFLKTLDNEHQYLLSQLVSKPECKKELKRLVPICTADKAYRIILNQSFLLMSLCSKSHKDEFPQGCFKQGP